jgi:hypothetical protein
MLAPNHQHLRAERNAKVHDCFSPANAATEDYWNLSQNERQLLELDAALNPAVVGSTLDEPSLRSHSNLPTSLSGYDRREWFTQRLTHSSL